MKIILQESMVECNQQHQLHVSLPILIENILILFSILKEVHQDLWNVNFVVIDVHQMIIKFTRYSIHIIHILNNFYY
jgi:hypothetical protein